MRLLERTIGSIGPIDKEAADRAGRRLDSLTKPVGSLGLLEEIARRYAAIRHDDSGVLGRIAITIFAADHGVVQEGVSAYPSAVTAQMVRNLANGGAAIAVLARRFGYQLLITDIGVAGEPSLTAVPGVRCLKLGAGTRNFLNGPAMSTDQARRAIQIGIETAQNLAESGVTLIGTGEMGIGSTTSASALIARLTGIDPTEIVGRGTGLDDAGLRRKREVVKAALVRHATRDPIEALAAFGGFEIGALAGVCLGGAAARIPVVVDGFVATAGALIAERLRLGLRESLFFGHRSAEGGHAVVLDKLGVRPILDLDMRLGEGSGAALAMRVIESALALYTEMATFADAGVSGKNT